MFTNVELGEAFAAFKGSGDVCLPSGNILGVSETTADSSDVTVETDLVIGDRVTISRAKMGAVLIQACKRLRIPLPVAADKSIAVIKGSVALRVVLSDKARSRRVSKPIEQPVDTGISPRRWHGRTSIYFHDHDRCDEGKRVPLEERIEGDGKRSQCVYCAILHARGS